MLPIHYLSRWEALAEFLLTREILQNAFGVTLNITHTGGLPAHRDSRALAVSNRGCAAISQSSIGFVRCDRFYRTDARSSHSFCHAAFHSLATPVVDEENRTWAHLVVSGFATSQEEVDEIATRITEFDTDPPDLQDVPVLSESEQGRVRKILEALATQLVTDLPIQHHLFETGNVLGIVGRSAATMQTIQVAQRLAESLSNAVIVGEGGTDRTRIAASLHQASPIRSLPLRILRCAGVDEAVLEQELFDEGQGLAGLTCGSLILESVDALSIRLQSRLLQRLDTSSKNIRILATTSADLQADITTGRFRSDLYFKLAIIELRLPPLRERLGDLHELILHHVRLHRRQIVVGQGVIETLCTYPWPGNDVELRSEIDRWLLDASDEIRISHISESIRDSIAGRPRPAEMGSKSLEDWLLLLERDLIFAALERNGQNRTRAARELGISRTTLIERLKRFTTRAPTEGD